ncbi:MAG: beta-galactosidase [Candidatus Pacebacteria bacterium]|nr:beta-galactosidase [Candidatus Paceibacterota bacterium]
MARTVCIENNQIRVGDSYLPLISGEFHFWRTQRSNWERILETSRGMGLKIVSTYVAWSFHEQASGEFDFQGRVSPETDLAGFLRLTRDLGLYVIMRPGPFIYAEWPGGGPPSRTQGMHRLSSSFLEASRDYIEAVGEVMHPFLATNGGHIVLVQVDNEPWPDLELRAEELGAAARDGLFSQWLRTQYDDDIAALNRKWRASFSDFDDCCVYFEECYVNRDIMLSGRLLPDEKYIQRLIDGQKFVEWCGAEIIAKNAAMYRAAGVNVPLYMNGWQPYAQNFHLNRQNVDLAGVDGLHRHRLYFDPSEPEFDNDFRWYLESFKMTLHDTDGIGYAAEMGIGHPTGGLANRLKFAPKPQNNTFDYLMYMANGMKAWNWYTLVDRDGWACGAINQFGEETPYAEGIREALKVADAVHVAELESTHTCSLITHKGHRYTESGNWTRVWDALMEADIDFSLVDPDYKPIEADLVVYGGASWLPSRLYPKLKTYVEQGGTLVFFSHYPAYDEYGACINPFTMPEPDMIRPVNLPVSIGCGRHEIAIETGGHNNRKVHFAGFLNVPDGYTPIRVGLSSKAKQELVDIKLSTHEHKSFPAGYIRSVGEGKIVYIGSNPDPRILTWILDIVQVSYLIRTDTPGVLTHLWKRPDGAYVAFAVNRSSDAKYAKIMIDARHLGLASAPVKLTHVRDEKTQTLDLSEDNSFTVFISGHDVWVGSLAQQ